MSQFESGFPTPGNDHGPGCWEQHHTCARIHLRAALAHIERARQLMIDLRVNSTHPRHLQWRQECDDWLAIAPRGLLNHLRP